MAGDWLKFECNLPEKPETLAITTAMGWEDPDITVGKLMRLFRWFDQHTINGNANGVTAASLDRIIGVSGFAQAVANCGWLVFDSVGVSLQKFDRHNGASAKSRAQTAKRVANHRGKAEDEAPEKHETADDQTSNAATVTKALAREEKRREEKKEKTTPAAFVPPDWIPAETWTAYLAVRKTKRAGKEPSALALIVKDLAKFQAAGYDPVEILETSIKSAWVGVFEPKARYGQHGSGSLGGSNGVAL